MRGTDREESFFYAAATLLEPRPPHC